MRNTRSTEKNITRFTYEFTSFQGWRVTLCRKQRHFTRYFSDKQYGGATAAFEAAVEVRNRLMDYLKKYPEDPDRAFSLCREEEPQSRYPKGLRPRKGHEGPVLRSQPRKKEA